MLYGELARLTGSPVVELNRAVAVAESGDVEAALAIVEGLELDRYHYLHATRAELLRRLDRRTEAAEEYRRALELARLPHERRFLERRPADCVSRCGAVNLPSPLCDATKTLKFFSRPPTHAT